MLIDKGYYDYDYQEPKKQTAKSKSYDESVRSDEEMQSILSRFGWGKPKASQPLTPEDAQRIAMEEAKTLKSAKR
jgi:hypothetical protein